MTPTATPTPVPFENASMSLQSGMADTTGVAGFVILGLYILGALLAAQYAAPWLARSRLLTRAGNGIATSLAYAIKGAAATAVLAIAAAPLYLLTMVQPGTRGIALRAIAIAAAGYILLVGVGWLADRATTAFVDAHPDIDTLSDLLPDPESESDQPIEDSAEVTES